MNVRFLGSTEIYHLQVTVPGSGLVQLYPPFPDVDLTVGFELLTPKGTVYGNYQDYTTVYRQLDDGGIILSNDGRVWTPPPEPLPPEPVPEPEPPTLEELQNAKKTEVNETCSQIIRSGVSVTLEDGRTEHFELTIEDQIAFLLAGKKLLEGKDRIEWHPNGDCTLPCVFYSNTDMAAITQAVEFHVSYHQTYCNSLKIWIEACQTKEELEGIFYGADIPEKYQSMVLKDYLARIMAQAEKEVEEQDEALV